MCVTCFVLFILANNTHSFFSFLFSTVLTLSAVVCPLPCLLVCVLTQHVVGHAAQPNVRICFFAFLPQTKRSNQCRKTHTPSWWWRAGIMHEKNACRQPSPVLSSSFLDRIAAWYFSDHGNVYSYAMLSRDVMCIVHLLVLVLVVDSWSCFLLTVASYRLWLFAV